jgi:hypothetical protein
MVPGSSQKSSQPGGIGTGIRAAQEPEGAPKGTKWTGQHYLGYLTRLEQGVPSRATDCKLWPFDHDLGTLLSRRGARSFVRRSSVASLFSVVSDTVARGKNAEVETLFWLEVETVGVVWWHIDEQIMLSHLKKRSNSECSPLKHQVCVVTLP